MLATEFAEESRWKLSPADETPQAGARALTDREIGDRLFLSPRTVSSHLYRSYPKLGVASRRQLRDVIGLTWLCASRRGGCLSVR
jgi:hypothetical protein